MSWAAWSTNYLHIVHTEVTPLENLRFTNATERACFALTNNNGQVANWTISPVVAGGPMLHASKTGGAGSATHVDNATSVWVQAGTAPGRYTITATHPNCPVSTTNATFTVGRVDVESLLFNWDTTGSARDAINLRWNYTNEINLATGEWTRAGYRAPACYVTNASPLVKATFSVAPTNLPVVRLFAETSAAVGGFAATNVAFAGGAASDVALSTKSATTNCILKETFDLTWKAVVSNETEIVTNTLGKTDGHVFYTIIGEPKLPWTDSEIANTNVWVSALEFVTKTNACFGETTQHGAISNLTRCLFQDCHFTYDTTSGNPHFFDSTNRAFQMSDYVSAANTTTDKTVKKYLDALEDAFIFEKARRYDVKGKAYLDSPVKYYATDVGLRNARLGFRQIEETHLTENILYNDLIRRGYAVDVGTVRYAETKDGKKTEKQHEIDFVVNLGTKKVYIQSAFQINDEEKRRQEILPLLKSGDFFKKIVVTSGSAKPHMDDNGIQYVGIIPFLLDENSIE